MAKRKFKKYPILIKFGIWGFLISLITNLSMNFRNSKWLIQYDGHKSKNYPIEIQVTIASFFELLITNPFSYS